MERLKLETIENIIKTHRTVVEVLENENIDDDYDLSLDKCIIYGMDELKQYRIAEEQGFLLRLPVPEGTTVYQICRTVIYGEVGDKGEFNYFWHRINFDRKMVEEWGKTVFFTKEEAEQALAKMKEA